MHFPVNPVISVTNLKTRARTCLPSILQ